MRAWAFFFECDADVATFGVDCWVAVVAYIAVYLGVDCVVFSYSYVFAWKPFGACTRKMVSLVGLDSMDV